MPPIQIKAPDGSIAQFAEGTPDTVIESVMAKEFGRPNPQTASTKVGNVIRQGLSDVGAGFAAPFQKLGGDVAQQYHQTSEALQGRGSMPGITGTAKLIGDTAGLVTAPVSAITNPIADALSRLGHAYAPGTMKTGPRLMAQPETQQALNSDLITALSSKAGNVAPGVSRAATAAGSSIAKGVRVGGAKVGSVIDAGSTPAAEAVRASALAKIMEQQQTLANAKKAVETKKAIDVRLRPTMEQRAALKESMGISPADTPEAQRLVADLQSRLNPSGPIAPIPNTDQRAAYKKVIDVLAPKSGPKPDFATVQGLRRDLATAYSGDQTGFAALNKGIRKELAESLNAVENAHTRGLQSVVQQNYTDLIKEQKQANKLEKIAPDINQAAMKLDIVSPQDSVQIAKSIVDKMQKKGLVSDKDYKTFITLAENAKNTAGKAAFRKKIATFGLAAIGAGKAVHFIP